MDASQETGAAALVARMGAAARAAAEVLRQAPAGQRAEALRRAAAAIEADADAILADNAEDVAEARARGLDAAMLDRLALDPGRLAAVAAGMRAVADQPDPVGKVLADWARPNGLRIQRVATPIGVLGVIYESRPNVTADAAALAVKSGNAVILRGGSESLRSSAALAGAIRGGLAAAGLPADAVQLVGDRDRALVTAMLQAQGLIDVIIPRGGKGLVALVQREARVPVFAHLEGICHVYADRAADPAKARAVVVDAKMRRTGICGAAECLLIDRAYPDAPGLIAALVAAGAEVRADGDLAALPGTVAATAEDFGREFLAPVIAVRLVDGVAGAIAHIRAFGSQHTDAILTEDDTAAEAFFAGLDSAILIRNASTQFADGGEFGMGAEIGIATGKMHARGPVGAEQLTTFQYRVTGDGTVRG